MRQRTLLRSLTVALVLQLACLHSSHNMEATGALTLVVDGLAAEARCLQFEIVGSSPAERRIDVVPGEMRSWLLTGLPLGAGLVTVSAYVSACSGLGTAEVPPWISDALPVVLSAARPVDLRLTLHENVVAPPESADAQVPDGSQLDGGLLDASPLADSGIDGSPIHLTDAAGNDGAVGDGSVERDAAIIGGLTEVLTLAEGDVIDFDGTRALAVSASGKRAVIEWITGERQVIYDNPAGPSLGAQFGVGPPPAGQLFPGGAVLRADVGGTQRATRVWIWKTSLQEVDLAGGTATSVNGSWLAYAHRTKEELGGLPPELGPDGGPTTTYNDELILVNLATDASETVVGVVPITQANLLVNLAVGPNGDLLWEDSRPVSRLRWRRYGMPIQALPGYFVGLQSDGINFAFATGRPGNGTSYLLLPDGGVESFCTSTYPGLCQAAAILGGWAAYSSSSPTSGGTASDSWQPFRRTPAGEHQSLGTVPGNAYARAVSSEGEVLIESSGHRYLYLADRTLHEITTLGTVVFRDRWYAFIGPTVYVVDAASP